MGRSSALVYWYRRRDLSRSSTCYLSRRCHPPRSSLPIGTLEVLTSSELLFRNSYLAELRCRCLGVSTWFFWVTRTNRHRPFPHQRDRYSYDRRTLAKIQGGGLSRLPKDDERVFSLVQVPLIRHRSNQLTKDFGDPFSALLRPLFESVEI